MKQVIRLALGGIAVGVLVLALKYAAYRVTGSVALYSDALESIINVATAVAAFLAVRLSAVPPDANHPYGHHKVEYLSAVMEGVLIVRRRPRHPAQGLSRLSRSAADRGAGRSASPSTASPASINAVWCFVLFRCRARRWRSPALARRRAASPHRRHHLARRARRRRAGRLSPAGCVLDSIIAALVALHILWWGWVLMRQSIGGLMDEARVQRRAGEDPRGDLQGGGRRARGARPPHAACRAHDLHRVPPGGAGAR